MFFSATSNVMVLQYIIISSRNTVGLKKSTQCFVPLGILCKLVVMV